MWHDRLPPTGILMIQTVILIVSQLHNIDSEHTICHDVDYDSSTSNEG